MTATDRYPTTGRRGGALSAPTLSPRAAAAQASVGHEKLPFTVIAFMVALVVPIGFNLGPLALDLVRLVLILSIAPLGLKLITGKCGKLYVFDYLLLAHIIWSGISTFINHPELAVENVGISSIEFIGAYLVGRVGIRSRAQFMAMSKLAAALVVATLPFAALETQTGNPIIIDTIRSLPGLRSFANVHHEPRLGMLRAQVVFIHPIHYGLFCSTALPLVFVGLQGVMSNTMRVIVTLLVAACCVMSVSSGAILAMALQVFLISWAFIFRNLQWRWMLLTILFALIYIGIDVLSARTPLEVFMSYATFSAHNAFWRRIILEWGIMNVVGNVENGVVGHPWFGRGLFDWERPSFMGSGSMDNFWLVLAVRHGLPALLFFVAGLLWVTFKIGRRDFKSDPALRLQRRAWMFLIIGLSFTLATVHIWGALYTYVMFLLGAGVWLLSVEPLTDGKPADGDGVPEVDHGPRHTPYTRFPRQSEAPALSTPAPAPSRTRAGKGTGYHRTSGTRQDRQT